MFAAVGKRRLHLFYSSSRYAANNANIKSQVMHNICKTAKFKQLAKTPPNLFSYCAYTGHTHTRAHARSACIYAYKQNAHSSAHPRTSSIFARDKMFPTHLTFVCSGKHFGKNDNKPFQFKSTRLTFARACAQGSMLVTPTNEPFRYGFAARACVCVCLSDAGACENKNKNKNKNTYTVRGRASSSR